MGQLIERRHQAVHYGSPAAIGAQALEPVGEIVGVGGEVHQLRDGVAESDEGGLARSAASNSEKRIPLPPNLSRMALELLLVSTATTSEMGKTATSACIGRTTLLS